MAALALLAGCADHDAPLTVTAGHADAPPADTEPWQIEAREARLRGLTPPGRAQGWLYLVALDRGELQLGPPPRATDDRARWNERRQKHLRDGKAALLRAHQLPDEAVRYRYDALPMLGLWLNKAQAEALLDDTHVEDIFPNKINLLDTSTSLSYLNIPSSGGVNADATAGQGGVVAVIDGAVQYWGSSFGGCGAQFQPQLGLSGCRLSRLSHFTDCAQLPFLAPGYQCVPGTDSYEGVAASVTHGSNVAGVALNVAPGAKVWSLNATHVIRQNGTQGAGQPVLFDADIIDALDAIYAQPAGVTAVNLSLGTTRGEGQNDYCASPTRAAFRSLWEDHGIIPVVATGNSGYKNGTASPACDPFALSVGAHYDTEGAGAQISFGPNGATCQEQIVAGRVGCFSNSQTQVDLVAPGVLISGGGFQLSGTSQAAPPRQRLRGHPPVRRRRRRSPPGALGAHRAPAPLRGQPPRDRHGPEQPELHLHPPPPHRHRGARAGRALRAPHGP
jgi:hypothetical protein